MYRSKGYPRSPRKPTWLQGVLQNQPRSSPNLDSSSSQRASILRQQYISLIDPKKKAQLRWLEQWDIDSVFTDNVDLANSQSALSIPLVDVALSPGLHISLSMSYTSGDVTNNGLLGNGWNVHHVAQDYIVVDHKQSAFSQNHQYQLSIEGQLMNLVASKETEGQFSIDNEPDVQITFEKSQNRWIIDTPNMRTVYGASEDPSAVPDALHWSLHWPYWRGPGRDEAGLVPEVISWYMISRQDKHGLKRKLYYRYLTENRTTSVASKSFTSVILLESIYDSENKYTLNLIYDTKESSEYPQKSYRDTQDNIQFPVHLLTKHYLLGYHLETEGYQQQLQFDYIPLAPTGVRMLTSVYQIFNENGGRAGQLERIFNMKYDAVAQKKHLLSELEVPTYHSSLKYGYTKLEIPLLSFERPGLNTLRFPVVDNVQVSQGGDYGTQAFDLGTGGIYVRIFNRQLTKYEGELYTGNGGKYTPSLELTGEEEEPEDPKKIKRFATLLYADLIAVLEETGEEKRLHIFHREKETKQWPRSPGTTIKLKKEAMFRYTEKLMVMSKNEEGSLGQLTVIQPIKNKGDGDDDDEEFEEGYKMTTLRLSNGGGYTVNRLVVQDDVILAYNGYRLHGWKESEKMEEWEESVISELHSEEAEFFNRFVIEDKNINAIREQMNVTGLHLSDNMILLSAVKWRDTGDTAEVTTNAHLILVDHQLRKVKEEVHAVKTERIRELEKLEESPDKTRMYFRYRYNSGQGRFLVYLHDIAGTQLETACKEADDKAKCKQELLKMYNEDTQFQKDMQEILLFDHEPLMTFQLEPTGATTKTSRLVMTGTGWASRELSDKGQIKLGTGFVLETTENRNESETSYALYRQNPENGGKVGAEIDNWTMHNQRSGMSVGYPSYLGMQPDVTQQLVILPFREEGETMARIPVGERGEQLLRMSNHEILFTIVNSTDASNPTFDKELIVRRVNSVVPSTPIWALAKGEVKYGEDVRVRTYENEFSTNADSITQENVIRVVPADDKSYSGYYEEITVVPVEAPENATKTQKWYDASGEVIRTKAVEKAIEEQQKQQEEDEENAKWHKIWDATGQLEIADIAPYNRTDEAVDYFGFESYENSTISWEYPEESLVTTEIPFTGQNMVRLRSGQMLKGSLTPKDQRGTYVASTWIRLPGEEDPPEFEFEGPLEHFKARLSTHTGYPLFGIYGQMKRQLRDWLYLEVILDLDKIRNNVYSEVYRYSDPALNLPPPSTTNFTISVETDSASSSWVDVDHVRFSPINLDFTVNVYDPRSGRETEQILGSGGVIRKIYNDYGTEVSSVDESGQVEQFKSLSRSGFIFPPPNSDSNLGIQEIRREVVVMPEQGQFEMFDQYSLRNLWSLEDSQDLDIWRITRGRMEHLSEYMHTLTTKSSGVLFDPVSSAIRLHVHFSMDSSQVVISLAGLPNLIRLQGNGTLDIASGCRTISNLPSAGEILFHLTEDTLWFWYDGVLLFDRKLDRSCRPANSNPGDSPWSQFQIEISGPLTISNVITLAQPQINVEHFNAWGDRTQVVQLEDCDTALVSETIYDEMGRDAIKTKSTRVSRSAEYTPLLTYYPDFVKNRSPGDIHSVFKVGTVDGLANTLNPEDEGYPYSRTLYQDDMLREVRVEGLPGKAFSTFGTFNKQHGRHSGLPFLQILFPSRLGFREKVTYEPNGNLQVSVLDSNENEIASYTKVAGFDNILTIYEYDDKQRLVKMLPPKYHQKMRTFWRTTPWNFGDDKLTEDEKYWQGEFGTHYQYDDLGQLIQKKGPDHRTKGFLYDPMGNIRFMYTVNPGNETLSRRLQNAEDIVYMLHSGKNKPVEIGYFKDPVNVGDLMNFQNGTAIPSSGESQVHQRIVYSETHSDPEMRGKVRLFLTYDDHYTEDPTRSGTQQPPHQELLKFNAANHVVIKTSNAVHTDTFTNYQKHYRGGKLREMAYPRGKYSRMGAANETVFNLIQGHDKMGRVTNLGTRQDPSTFAQLSYNAAGQVTQEMLDPVGILHNATVGRQYEYNAPGLLTAIRDPNLSQQMSFIEGGYGQRGYGDGILMTNVMNAEWSRIENLDEGQKQWFRIPQEDFADDKVFNMCIQALKRVGIVDADTNIPVRFLTRALLSELPLTCDGEVGHKLMKLVAKYLPPTTNYGHSYSYGSHQELTKAKYFGDGVTPQSTLGPLKMASFLEEIEEVEGLEEAETIWDKLTSNGYLIVDNGIPEDKTAAIGKQGVRSFFRFSEMERDLKEVEPNAGVYAEPILKLIYQNVVEGADMALGEFQDIYVNWHGYLDTPTATIIINMARQAAARIYDMLIAKEYLSGDIDKLLDSEYLEMMEEHKAYIGQITKVMTDHFASQIGSNLYDFESYSIDPNGNHGMFYAGLNRHQLEYDEASNQVQRLRVREPFLPPGEDEKVTELEHDNLGNVNKAEHRGVKLIRYHPVTNRPMLMELVDGRRIVIKYDAQGERLLKRVFGQGNRLLSETKYLRDENGMVLMDKLTKFGENGDVVQELESTYLYGPRGTILGFIRNGKFYNVFTDHAGSTRLITQAGKVVAGYDYWPYGEMIRSFGDEDAHLMYRFTGQEYDEETGLYNYHARIYDPTMGRFFQPDPKSQYFSPYVYGGNSPVSLVDPDGEFFFLLCVIIGAVVGAYFAGAAANGSWNPMKWDWKSGKTWQAIIGGAIGGAMLPGAFMSAVASIGVIPALLVGVAGSYIKMAQQNGSWNPADWNWADPATYNAFLEGFSNGLAKGPDAIANAKGLIQSFSKTGHKLLLEMVSGTGMALIKGAMANDKNFKFWEWEWSDPGTLSAIKDGFFTGKGFPEQASKAYRGFADMAKNGNWKEMLKDMRGTTKNFMKDIFKNPKHPLWKTMGKAVISYVATGKEQGTLDFTKWDWHSQSTYESLLNNYKIGSELKNMMETYRKRDWVLAGVDFFRKEIQQRGQVHPVLENIFDGMDAIWKFYDLPSMPFQKRQEYLEHVMMPVAMKMFLELNGNVEGFTKGEWREDDDQFRKDMEEIVGGFRAGSNIYPVFSEDIADLIDCEAVKGGGNGRKEAGFEKCSIGSADGNVARQNRELVKKLFLATKLYQSKNDFVAVKTTPEPEEFVEHILQLLGGHRDNREKFLESFLLGSVYHSILNTEATYTSKRKGKVPPQLYFLEESVATLDLNLVHVAMATEKDDKKVLTVRTFIASSTEKFEAVKDDLVVHLKTLKYQCYLPVPSDVDAIQGEAVAMVTGRNGTEMHVITPDYLVGGVNCDGNPQKFRELPVPTTNIFEAFTKFLDEEATQDEKTSYYEAFLSGMSTIFGDAKNLLLGGSTFLGFAYGLISANLKETFSISLEITKTSGENKILLVAQRNSKGQSTWHGTPALITTTGVDHLSQLLHKSGLQSLSKTALIGNVENGSVSVTTQSLPSFGGILDAIVNGGEALILENLVKFLYYNHYVVKSAVTTKNKLSENNNHFISNFILGELLSRIESTAWEMYVLAPSDPTDQQRLQGQRLFFLRNPENDQAKIINVIESSVMVGDHFEFDDSIDMTIPSIPEVNVSSLQMVLVKLNPNSVDGWSPEESLSENVTPAQGFFQDVQISDVSWGNLRKDSTAYLKLESPFSEVTSGQLSFSKGYITNMFEKLKENRLQLLVNMDEDLQSVVTGLLMGASVQVTPDSDGISMAMRKLVTPKDSGAAPTTLSLLSLTKEGYVVPQTEQVLLASLKAFEEDFGEEKMEEARRELKDYQCTREGRLKEAFKVSSVPAVYDSREVPENGDRVTFEVDPESLADMNCTAPENPFQQYLRKDDPIDKAGGEGIYGFIKNKFSQYFGHVEAKQVPKDVNVEGCHLGAWVNGEGYSVDGITCTSGKSRMAVFRRIQENDLVTLSGRGRPFSLVGDEYKTGACAPVSWNGKPSVACEGDKTTLIYTPYYAPRLFDELDGNMMLGRVAVHLGGKLWTFVRQGGRKQMSGLEDIHIVPEEMMAGWEKNAAGIREALGKWEGPKEDIAWAKEQLAECEAMMADVRNESLKASPDTIEEITERLEALQEDITEQMLFAMKPDLEGYMEGGAFTRESESGLGGNAGYPGMGANGGHGVGGYGYNGSQGLAGQHFKLD